MRDKGLPRCAGPSVAGVTRERGLKSVADHNPFRHPRRLRWGWLPLSPSLCRPAAVMRVAIANGAARLGRPRPPRPAEASLLVRGTGPLPRATRHDCIYDAPSSIGGLQLPPVPLQEAVPGFCLEDQDRYLRIPIWAAATDVRQSRVALRLGQAIRRDGGPHLVDRRRRFDRLLYETRVD